MAARATMADLITKLRRLVNDAGGSLFDDDALQAYLDARRWRANYLVLDAEAERQSGGDIDYLNFQAPHGDWEADAALLDANFDALTPATADLATGRWTFATEPSTPVYLRGWTYDLYAAAADALEERAAQLAPEYTFSADGGQFVRSQAYSQTAELVGRYRRMQRVGVTELVRGDVTANGW